MAETIPTPRQQAFDKIVADLQVAGWQFGFVPANEKSTNAEAIVGNILDSVEGDILNQVRLGKNMLSCLQAAMVGEINFELVSTIIEIMVGLDMEALRVVLEEDEDKQFLAGCMMSLPDDLDHKKLAILEAMGIDGADVKRVWGMFKLFFNTNTTLVEA